MVTSGSNILSKEPILAESYFEVDKEGWSMQGDCTLTHSPTEGNPGGCLKAVDAVTGDVFYYLAPAKFLGDKRSAVRLDYDIKWVEPRNLPIFAWDREVELAGGGTLLIYHYQIAAPPRNTWFHYSVPLYASSSTGQRGLGVWTNVTKNRPATDEDFKVVLTSLGKLAIRGEFAHGGPEIGYLDNVVMYRVQKEVPME